MWENVLKNSGKKKGDDISKNGSGCSDPTARKAICKVIGEMKGESEAEYRESKQRLDEVLNIVNAAVRLAGFELEERIVLKDKKTGRVWR